MCKVLCLQSWAQHTLDRSEADPVSILVRSVGCAARGGKGVVPRQLRLQCDPVVVFRLAGFFGPAAVFCYAAHSQRCLDRGQVVNR